MIRLREQVDYNHTIKSLLYVNVEGFLICELKARSLIDMGDIHATQR